MSGQKFIADKKGRLDRLIHEFLLSSGEEISRAKIKNWIERAAVRVNGVVISKSGAAINPSDEIVFNAASEQKLPLAAMDLKLDLLFEDEWLLVINKPSALSVHPGAGNRDTTLVNALVGYLGGTFSRLSGDDRPGIVHRLDKDTTGVIIVAKNEKAHTALSKMIASREVARTYLALVLTSPKSRQFLDTTDEGVIRASIGRDPKDRKKMAVITGGKEAVTHFKVIDRMGYANLIEVKLETGRTHQIRVHMTHIGSPILGDKVYGQYDRLPTQLLRISEEFGRQALHAVRIEFIHPFKGIPIKVEAPVPEDLQALIDTFRSYTK